jgi:hypothetical protein
MDQNFQMTIKENNFKEELDKNKLKVIMTNNNKSFQDNGNRV